MRVSQVLSVAVYNHYKRIHHASPKTMRLLEKLMVHAECLRRFKIK